jgi:hypothetical protein
VRRDAIYAALTAQLEQLLNLSPYNVRVVSRGFVDWTQADVQPAIYIVPGKETPAPYKRGLPQVFLLQLDLYIYAKWVDSVEQGARALAVLMDGVEYIISPGGPNGGVNPCSGFVNTLGGLADYCALQGTAEISIGFLNQNQSIARMPVEIKVLQ